MDNLNLQPGDLVDNNRYKIVKFIAKGGMANVYHAYDQVTKQNVCLKVLLETQLDKPSAVRRFNREYQIMADIHHPNIIDVRGRFNLGNVKCIVSELVVGHTLKDRIIRFGPLTVEEVLPIVDQICEGLKVVHDYNIVHRDIKPENILISNSGEVKISDFGISIKYNDNNFKKTDVAIGTPKYMAPEGILKQKISYTYDVYALGILLYECLVGYPPFSRFNPDWIARQQIQEIPIDVRLVNDKIPQSISNVIIRAMLKNRHERTGSVAQFQNDLYEAAYNPKFTFAIKPKQSIYMLHKNRLIKRRMWDRYRYFPNFLNLKFLLPAIALNIISVLVFFWLGYWV